MKTAFKTFTVLSVAAVLAACGSKDKNPLEKYDDLNKDIVPYASKSTEQKYDVCSAVVIAEPLLVVAEGETVETEVSVRGTYSAKTEGLAFKNAPKGLSKAKKINSPDGELKFEISYTAEASSLEKNENYKTAEFEILPASQMKGFVQCSQKMGIVITRSNQQPEITKLPAPVSVNLDSTKSVLVTVDVNSAALNSESELILFTEPMKISKNSNQAMQAYDAMSAVRYTGDIKKVKAGLYRMTVSIDPVILRHVLSSALADKSNVKKSEFDMVAQITAYNSEVKLDSATQNLVFKAVRTLPAEVQKEEAK